MFTRASEYGLLSRRLNGVNVAVLNQIGLPSLLDIWLTPWDQLGDMLCLSSLIVLGLNRLPSGEILSFHKSPEGLFGSENVSRAYIGVGMSIKWVKFLYLGELSL